jgi:hypothetical protein
MVQLLAIKHKRSRFVTRRTRERARRVLNLRHIVLPAIVIAMAGGAFAVDASRPWTVTITDPEKHIVEAVRGDEPKRTFHYGTSEAGEMYFCTEGGRACSPVRGFDPDLHTPQELSQVPLP